MDENADPAVVKKQQQSRLFQDDSNLPPPPRRCSWTGKTNDIYLLIKMATKRIFSWKAAVPLYGIILPTRCQIP